MKLMQNGAAVALTGEATVKIPGPGGFSRKKLAVYDLTGETPAEVSWSLSEDGSQIEIKTDHLGLFAVVQKTEKVASEITSSDAAPADNEKEGNVLLWVLLSVGGVLVLAAAGVLIFLKVKGLAFFAKK